MGKGGRACLNKFALQYGADLKSKLIRRLAQMVNTRYLRELLELSRLTYFMYQGNWHKIIYEHK